MGKKDMHHAKHRNQVRICGGMWRGRKVAFADAEGLRPTPEMVRERLFNWLGQDLTGQSVLDAFGGSGILAWEAASRHAARVVLVERSATAAAGLVCSASLLGAGQVEVVRADVLAFMRHADCRFDGVFLDPPFVFDEWPQLFDVLFGCLNDGAWVYVEAAAEPRWPAWLSVHRSGRAGKSRYWLLYADGVGR